MNLLKPLESKWYTLGIQLQIKKHALDSIESNHQQNGTHRCLTEVVSYWQQNGILSWEKLANAVENVGGFGQVVMLIRNKCVTQKNVICSQYIDTDDPGYGSCSYYDVQQPNIIDTTSLSPACGCGECDIHKMCTEGCPKPDHTKHLPVLAKRTGRGAQSQSASKRVVPSAMHDNRLSADFFEQETASICEHFGSLVAQTCIKCQRRS